MKNIQFIWLLLLLAACSTAKVAVPDQFKSQAVDMKVKGVNGFKINQSLNFGPYKTSRIKRGWDFAKSTQYTRFGIEPEDFVLRVFDIGSDRKKTKEQNKFQYTISDENLAAEIFAQEKFSSDEFIYKSKHPLIGEFTRTKSYEYDFGAAIVVLAQGQEQPWSLVMTNKYNEARDTARQLFDRAKAETTGYATNGKETIEIRPLMLRSVTTASGKKTNVVGGALLSGYEFRIDDGVIGVVDILDNRVWMYKELDSPTKMVLSAISSAILLKRIRSEQELAFR